LPVQQPHKIEKKKPPESSVSWPITQLEHLHQGSVRHPGKNISHIQVLVTNFFFNPTHQTETGAASSWGLLIATYVD
jgi:hypothetical protein